MTGVRPQTMWKSSGPGDDGKEIPAVWNLDRYLCDLVSAQMLAYAAAAPAHRREAAFSISRRLAAYVRTDYTLPRPETVEGMRQAWQDLGEIHADVDRTLPDRIAVLLDEYVAADADEQELLDKVRAVATGMRASAGEVWRDLGAILPSLWI